MTAEKVEQKERPAFGYIPEFQPREDNPICKWEHCIELMPLVDGPAACPTFGHECPGGVLQAVECRVALRDSGDLAEAEDSPRSE